MANQERKRSDRLSLRAQELMAEEREFVLPAAQWREFAAALKRPAKAKPRLRKLLSEPGVLGRL